MTRADRRTRTEKVKERRVRQVHDVAPSLKVTPAVAGKTRSKAPLDCGRPGRRVCKPYRGEERRVEEAVGLRRGEVRGVESPPWAAMTT